ncbi:alpha-1B-glycoprotein [Sigmodon hispidus]
MSLLATVLLLLGFTLDPATATTFLDTVSEAMLWLDPQSLLEPWENLTLTCVARFPTKDFQLIMDGWRLKQVHVNNYVTSYKFPLGKITSNTTGLYRCRCGVEPPTTELTDLNRWTMLSNLVEVTQKEPLPQPWLFAEPVPWITSHIATYVLCHAALRGVTFLLKLEGDDSFLEVSKAQDNEKARFIVKRPGNYTCSYRTHDGGTPSEPSATLTIKKYDIPPPPVFYFIGNYPKIKYLSTYEILACKAPRNVAEFQIRQGDKVLNIYGVSPFRDIRLLYVNLTELDSQGPFTCRYRLHRMLETWSEDSKPIELMWSDGTLPAPKLIAEPSSHGLEPGSTVYLRCTASKDGLLFGLQRQGDAENPLIQMLKPTGSEAVFELHDISTIDSGNYSCVYMEQAPPFSGSAPSELLELQVNGPPPRPKLEALWKGKVPLGREANFRCHTQKEKVNVELRRVGFRSTFWMNQATTTSSADLKLPFVGPQHTGNYTCLYTAMSPFNFESGMSNTVEVIVEEWRNVDEEQRGQHKLKHYHPQC